MNNDFKVINLKCPGCGAPLEVSSTMDEFSCGYCGAAQRVVRRGGTIALNLIGDAIAKVQAGTDKTAAELAIRRLRDDLEALKRTQAAQIEVQTRRHSGKQASAVLVAFFTACVSFVFLMFGSLFGWAGIVLVVICVYSIMKNGKQLKGAVDNLNKEFIAPVNKISAEITFQENLLKKGASAGELR